MTIDLFIKSFPPDFEFLKYCLKSIQRFATGFRRVVVVVPWGSESGAPTGTSERLMFAKEEGEGYLQQQNIKLHADCFSDAEFFTYMDSDTILTRPMSPDMLIVDNRRPRWLYTPYSSIDSGDGQTWKDPTAKLMMRPVPFEFMRRHPFTIPRWALIGFREWMWQAHGMSLERYIMSQPNREFSEFNAVAAWLWFHHHDRIEWHNTDEDMGTVFVHQHYSWGGLNDDTRRNIELALA